MNIGQMLFKQKREADYVALMTVMDEVNAANKRIFELRREYTSQGKCGTCFGSGALMFSDKLCSRCRGTGIDHP